VPIVATVPAPAQTRGVSLQVLNWIIALCGLWESGDILALFVPGFGDVPAFVWNHIVVGAILVVVGAWAARTSNADTARALDWLAAAGGVWLIVASFVLRDTAVAAALGNDVVVGAVVLVLGVWSALATSRPAR
jgi:hypothetical protein